MQESACLLYESEEQPDGDGGVGHCQRVEQPGHHFRIVRPAALVLRSAANQFVNATDRCKKETAGGYHEHEC